MNRRKFLGTLGALTVLPVVALANKTEVNTKTKKVKIWLVDEAEQTVGFTVENNKRTMCRQSPDHGNLRDYFLKELNVEVADKRFPWKSAHNIQHNIPLKGSDLLWTIETYLI